LTAAVVLAAGGSSRLGRPKQLVVHRGGSLLRHAIDCAQRGGCDPVLVVLGAEADRIAADLEESDVAIVINGDWRAGLASSIRAGVEAAQEQHPEPTALILIACDQPQLTAGIVRELRESVESGSNRLAACRYAGTIGVPAAFDRSLFGELRRLEGAGGAKPLLERRLDEAYFVDWPAGAIDVDRPEDLDALGRD